MTPRSIDDCERLLIEASARRERGDLGAAREHYGKVAGAGPIGEQPPNVLRQWATIGRAATRGLAKVAADEGRAAEAMALDIQLVEQWRRVPLDQLSAPHRYAYVGDLVRAAGAAFLSRPELASSYLAEARALWSPTLRARYGVRATRLRAELLWMDGNVADRRGDFDDASVCFAQALALLAPLVDRNGEAPAMDDLVEWCRYETSFLIATCMMGRRPELAAVRQLARFASDIGRDPDATRRAGACCWLATAADMAIRGGDLALSARARDRAEKVFASLSGQFPYDQERLFGEWEGWMLALREGRIPDYGSSASDLGRRWDRH